MMPMVLLGLVAIATAVPTEFAKEFQEPQVNKEGNLIPIYKPGFSYVNHNQFGMYPFEKKIEHDLYERQLLPYRHYYGKEQSPLAYKRNYFSRYMDFEEPEYYQDDDFYNYDPEMSFYKQDYNIHREQPTYNYFKKYFTFPYSQEYFYNMPHNYKYGTYNPYFKYNPYYKYNPYSYSQQYKQYYNYYPYVRQHQQYDSPFYYQYPKSQYYNYYPLINKQRSVEYVKPTAYDYMMYKNVLPHEQTRELPLDTTVTKRFFPDTTPVQQTLVGKVQYVDKDLTAEKIIETPIERKLFVQMQPIVSKTLQEQPIVGKPIVQEHEQHLVGKSLGYDQETSNYYRPLAYGQQNLIGKPLKYESFPSVGKVLPYQQQRIVSHDWEQSQQPNWRKVLYSSQFPSKNYYSYENQPIYIQKEQPAVGKIFDYDQHQLVHGQEYNDQQAIVEGQLAHDEHYQPIYGKGLPYDQLLDDFQRRHSTV